MLKGGKGEGRYVLSGIERIAAYTGIAGSAAGWVLGVSAPLAESPAARVDNVLLFTALIFLGMGAVAAFFASGIVARPFQIIEKQNKHLAELSEVAQAASEAKTNFLARMSHEMRTPLNAILGFSELMLSAPMDQEENLDHLEKIHTAGVVLLGTVNDILDISKIESGKFELVPVDYDLVSLLNDTVSMNITRIWEKPIRFGMKIDEKLPSRMIGDELRIRQICNNLLSNAFKYTREGNVDLCVSGETDGDSVWLTISVKDTGIGIAAEDMQKLFSDYHQFDSASNRSIEGTGLGLAIAKRVAEMMDGGITVESEYGKGSMFTARLRQRFVTDVPIDAPAVKNLKRFHFLAHRGIRNFKRAISPLPQAKVLVVDDVLTNLDVARGILKPYGMQVDCATGGQQAIDLVREEKTHYDAIFLDHMMPGMDGIEAARRIREDIGTQYAQTVPIIALTANAIAGNEQMFLENGFQAFLSKPIDIPRLDAVLKQWVRDRLQEEGEAGQSREGAADAGAEGSFSFWLAGGLELEGLDPKICLERVGGDEATLLQALKSYAANTPELLERLREPTEKTLRDYTIVAHGIKSSSYGIGAGLVGAMAEDLEYAGHSADFEFILKNNPAFLQAAEKLIAGLSAMLRAGEGRTRKQVKDKPEAGLLERLRKACADYDMDGVDAAMAELESFSYRRRAGLLPWLRERADRLEFQQIIDKLSEPPESTAQNPE
jgi:signal transduction histidine kinase/CheY-like chemotaxis protein